MAPQRKGRRLNADEVRLSTAIMTHPARAAEAEALAASLPELEPVVVVDRSAPGTGNVGNALRAWGEVAAESTHHLVLQDDVIPCEDFAAQVRRAVAARPEDAVSLFCEWGSRSAFLVRAAAWQGWGWARAVDLYTPSQGLVMPRAAAEAFAALDDTGEPDDHVLVRFLRGSGIANTVTVPNLLEHDDRPSLTANGFQGRRGSACAADPGAADFGTPVAGAGLERLPYVSWMRVFAEWCYCGPLHQDYTWVGAPVDTTLPEGLRKADLTEAFASDLGDAGPELPATVNEVTLFELWTAYFGLGLVQPEPVDGEPGPFAEAAFATALPGAFRRFLSARALDALSPAAGRLAAAAFRRGAAADIERPGADWYTDPHGD